MLKEACKSLDTYMYAATAATLHVPLQHTAPHCNTLQHTATQRNTLQHTATHRNTLQHTATHRNTPQHTATLIEMSEMTPRTTLHAETKPAS